MQLQLRQAIPLYAQLIDCATNKYVKAVVRDQWNNHIHGSPVVLESVGNGMYSNSRLQMPNTDFVTVQYFVYTDDEYLVPDPNEYTELKVYTLFIDVPTFIGNNLPQMTSTLLNWFQPITFTQVVQRVNENSQIQDTPYDTTFRGVWQPLSPQKLVMKPAGQRAWSWFQLHADPTLILNPNDVVYYLGTQFKVMEKQDYSRYGYIEYHVILDTRGNGP